MTKTGKLTGGSKVKVGVKVHFTMPTIRTYEPSQDHDGVVDLWRAVFGHEDAAHLQRLTLPTLLIIDMQVGMTWLQSGIRNNPGAESVILELLTDWRRREAPVVHVRHVSRTPGSPFWPGQSGAEFQPQLQPLQQEHVVEKNVPDAFIHTGLERWLHSRGQSSIVIVGVSTNNSVEATARTAGNLGFRTYVVSDATFAFEKMDLRGVRWPAEDVHAISLANLHGEYATVVSSKAARSLA